MDFLLSTIKLWNDFSLHVGLPLAQSFHVGAVFLTLEPAGHPPGDHGALEGEEESRYILPLDMFQETFKKFLINIFIPVIIKH